MTLNANQHPFNKLKAISFEKVSINDDFWSKRQRINREISIHHQYEKLEQDFHIDNFRVASGIKREFRLVSFTLILIYINGSKQQVISYTPIKTPI